MNDDRCQHVPISEGQSLCSCLDYIIWQKAVIATLMEVNLDLQRQLDRKPYKVLTPLSLDGRVVPTDTEQKETP